MADLMRQEAIDGTIEGLYQKGSNVKRIYSGADYQNLDIYQVNGTYYSTLEGNDDAYLAARAIQFFCPGIPQVYYVGLPAGSNDIELVERTKNGRDINRHGYDLDEIAQEIQRPVVQRLLRLMSFRSHYPAFNGTFKVEDTPEDQIGLTWRKGKFTTTLHVDLTGYATRITYYDPTVDTRKRLSV